MGKVFDEDFAEVTDVPEIHERQRGDLGKHEKQQPARLTLLKWAVVVVLVSAPALVKLFSYADYPGSDDAFIHIAVVENILRGDGWGIISNDRVNMSTSPLFTLILLPVFAVGSIGFAQLLSLGFSSAALGITFFATRAITKSDLSGFTALVIAATNVHLWRWSGTVMETSLAYLFVTVIAATALKLISVDDGKSMRRAVTLGVLIGLGTLVRFEIGMLMLLSVAAIWLARQPNPRKVAVLVVGGFTGTFLPWVLFATAYFGTPIPTTFAAKTTSALHLVNPAVTKGIMLVFATGFGVSALIAVYAASLAMRSADGRDSLRKLALPLAYLLSWPVCLFAFYYLKTSGLQSAGRYFLPGMATWPIAVGLLVATVPRIKRDSNGRRALLATALVGSLAAGLTINAANVRPVLTAFNGGYRVAMTHAAEYLRHTCNPGEGALIIVDIGIIARDGVGDCVLVDGGALATPSVRSMTIDQAIDQFKVKYVVQSIGRSPGELADKYPQLGLKLELSERYTEHGIAKAGQVNYLNIFVLTGGN